MFLSFRAGETPTLVVSLCDQASTDKLVGVSPARNDKNMHTDSALLAQATRCR